MRYDKSAFSNEHQIDYIRFDTCVEAVSVSLHARPSDVHLSSLLFAMGHIRVFREEDSACPVDGCSKTYARNSDLNRHKRTTHKNGTFVCKRCRDQNIFHGYDQYRKHIVEIHTDTGPRCLTQSELPRAETEFVRFLDLHGVPQKYLAVFPAGESYPTSVKSGVHLRGYQPFCTWDSRLSVVPGEFVETASMTTSLMAGTLKDILLLPQSRYVSC